MADEEIDMNRYYLRPGCTEPELRPEFAAEEAAMADAPVAPVKKKRASRKDAKVSKKK